MHWLVTPELYSAIDLYSAIYPGIMHEIQILSILITVQRLLHILKE